MDSNIFSRISDYDSTKKPCDYTVSELCSYLLHNYPNDPLGQLDNMQDNLDIGLVLGRKTRLILEGYLHAERKTN